MGEINISLRRLMWRGFCGRCPNCNQAPLFRAYLKPVITCRNCGERWEEVRADLGPAWAAMTLAAHIVVPIYHFFLFDSDRSYALQMAILITLALGICLAALPRMKGLFMAIVWAKGTTDS